MVELRSYNTGGTAESYSSRPQLNGLEVIVPPSIFLVSMRSEKCWDDYCSILRVSYPNSFDLVHFPRYTELNS